MVTANYKVGDLVFITDLQVEENYGDEYMDMVLTVESVSTSEADHPGFDSGCGSALYDFKEINFSLYDWEIELA